MSTDTDKIPTNEPYPSSEEDDTLDQTTSQDQSTMKGRQLDFNHGDFPWRDVSIQESDSNKLVYFADVSEYTANQPDITLHARGGEGPIVGMARFRWSFSIKCGLGSSDLNMDWTEMKRSGALHAKKFQFEHKKRAYSLVRTHSSERGVSGLKRVLMSHFKVVDDKSGEVIAYYTSVPAPGRKKGTLTIASGVDEQLEILIVLGVTSWREKTRRRAHRSAGGGGGGSSGG